MKTEKVLKEDSVSNDQDYIWINKNYLKTIFSKTKNLSTSLAAIKLDFEEMKAEYWNEFKRKMKDAFNILEKSKDFHLQHLVNIWESTKAIIQIVTGYSQESKPNMNLKHSDVQAILEVIMKEVLNLQKHLMRFTIDWFKTHQTNANTIDLYDEHFAGGDSHESIIHEGNIKSNHIDNGSDSDEYFLEDDEEEIFSSLYPKSVKDNNLEDDSPGKE